jgi:hypothetical protein
VLLAANGDDDLIEMPFVAEPICRSPADLAGEILTELFRPQPHGLVRNDNATSCKQILDHAQAERKTKVQPNGVGNHLNGKSMATIKRT